MRRAVVVGGGIVGAAIADGLAQEDGIEVTVLDRGPADRLLGSTGHAPGYVSLLSESPLLSRLAIASADLYDGLDSGAFERIGGLEVATSAAALANLHRRVGLADSLGIEAIALGAEDAASQAPVLINSERCVGGVLYPGDGVARGEALTRALGSRAARSGATFHHDTNVIRIDAEAGRVTAVHSSSGESYAADDVVVAAGIWGAEVAALAGEKIFFAPVEHPYVFGPARLPAVARYPFVKWRGETVYARDHGDRFGIGTHDHPGRAADTHTMAEAELPWSDEAFGDSLERAFELLPPDQRFPVDRRLNGVFSMTADNLPLVGPASHVEGLWIAEALWITHAGGGAQVLVDMMLGRASTYDGVDSLDPGRFAGQDPGELTARAMEKYRTIWMPSAAA